MKLRKCISEMKSLTSLDVGGCVLDCLPQGMGRLEKLYALTLKGNKRLVQLQECVEHMKLLISLDVNACDLDCLPQGMGRLEKLCNLEGKQEIGEGTKVHRANDLTIRLVSSLNSPQNGEMKICENMKLTC